MADIQPYEQRTLPQGDVGGRSANAGDMGIGQGISNLGAGITQAGDIFQQMHEAEDVTNVRVQMAKSETAWQQHLQERYKTAIPGDPTFANTIASDMSDYMQVARDTATTRAGQQIFDQLATNAVHQTTVQAMGMEAQLLGQAVKNNHISAIDDYSKQVFNDASLTQSNIQKANDLVDDPNGLYKNLTQPQRDELKYQAANSINYATGNGIAQNHSEDFLSVVKPELLDKAKQTQQAINTRSGSTVTPPLANISLDVLKFSPLVTPMSVKYGVSPNVLLAQIQQESGGNPNAVSPKGAMGLTQFMPATAAQYGVDPKDAGSSIQGQAHYMSDLLKMFNGDYTKALAGYNAGQGNVQKAVDKYGDNWLQNLDKITSPANAEQTRNYVSSILNKSGMSPNSTPVNQDPPTQNNTAYDNTSTVTGDPAKIGGLDWFNALTWEQQSTLINKADAQVRTNVIHGQQIANMNDKAIKAQQDKIQTDQLQSLIDGKLTVPDVMNNPYTTFEQKQLFYNKIKAGVDGPNKTDYPVFYDTLDKINKGQITDMNSIYPMIGNGVSYEDAQKLQSAITGRGSPQTAIADNAKTTAKDMMIMSYGGIAHPELSYEGAYRFANDLDAKLKSYKEQGKDTHDLFTPGTKDYVLDPNRIAGYMPTEKQVAANKAAMIINDRRPMITNDEGYGRLTPGTEYIAPDGTSRTKPITKTEK